MRVLHITTNYPTPDYPIFGIFVKEQVESLREKGVFCDVLYCDRKGKGTWMYITYIPKIWWKVLTGKYDVIHCHHALSALLLLSTIWPLFKKCVISFQNDPTTEWKINLFPVLYPFFHSIILKNKSDYLSYKKCFYLPNGCNEFFFVPKNRKECQETLGLSKEYRYILYMDSNKWGRTQKRKDRFDATLRILRTQYGYTDIREICLYNTPRELTPLYINSCSLHIISSDFEGSPNSVKECMCCNIPVVATDVGNIRDMIGDIPGNIVIDSFLSEDLAEAAQKVLSLNDNIDRRSPFLKKGYGMETVAEKLIKLYKS